ncbi:ABC transporter permease [Rhodococcus sp. C3V]|uniref:ABC transporter permease n=1 Tax=Rhodococcus sp. C3V TaxID=3034165 RepID=UPI0023E280E1|nr:ABC transporter permease [Rhodococcus sp. C3V]MDF3319986.1 ABC transporter permease [Rhodococcus sp. C3V]
MLKIRALQLLLIVGWLGSWQLTVSAGLLDPVLSKGPGQSWDYIVEAAKSGELWHNTRSTLSAVIIAWVLSCFLGVIAGVALGMMKTLERIVGPFLDAMNAMPRIAFAPLLVVALGIGTSAKIVLAFTIVFFTVVSGATAGVRAADSELLRLSAALGATKVQIFWKIMLPVATPAIFASLRLGIVYSLLGVISSEIIAAREGLGVLISQYSLVFQMEKVYAIIIFLAVIAVCLNQAMSVIERRLLRWQAPADH